MDSIIITTCAMCETNAVEPCSDLCATCAQVKPKAEPPVAEPEAKPEPKISPMEQLALDLEALAEGKAKKADMLVALKELADRTRVIRKDTMVWVTEQIKKAKVQPAPKLPGGPLKKAPENKEAKPKAGPKDPEKIIGVCPKCQGAGKYYNERTSIEGLCFRCKGTGQLTEQDQWDWNGHPSNPDRKPLATKTPVVASKPVGNVKVLATILKLAEELGL